MNAARVGKRICQRLSSEREEPLLSVSVGVAVYPDDGTAIATLLHAADCALYEMKQLKKAS